MIGCLNWHPFLLSRNRKLDTNLNNDYTIGSYKSLTLETTYTASSDGYVVLSVSYNKYPENKVISILVGNFSALNILPNTTNSTQYSVYVRKGISYKVTKNNGATDVNVSAVFVPIV